MKKTIGIALIVGLVVGLISGLLIKTVPALNNLIPDDYKSLVIGGLAGGITALFLQKRNKS